MAGDARGAAARSWLFVRRFDRQWWHDEDVVDRQCLRKHVVADVRASPNGA